MQRQVEYLDGEGPQYTAQCLEIVEGLVKEGYKHIVVASTSGKTGLEFAHQFKDRDLNLVVVTHSAGFKGPNTNEFSQVAKEEIERLGGKVHTGTILTHSLEKALAERHKGLYPTILIGEVLRIFSQGVKVACEIVMEACDAGLIGEDEEVVAVGGTGKGADTVCIVKSACSKRFLNLRVLEIVAKPR
ncbi:MAG TPA: hypothetical protein EYP78_03215 [Candidatus Omnitrophica bacterium]|nr:hypothetical protein [Candidatus Omnitrophota bacterium]